MSARPSSTVSDEVASRARGLSQYTRRLEGLYGERRIIEVDIRRVYAGAFISFYTYVERALERLFLGLLMGRLESADESVRALVEIRSENVARAVVTGGHSYVDWIPFGYTRKRAQAFFSRGLPFTKLTKSERRAFDRISVLRNAIAHQSSHSKRRFREDFTEDKTIPSSQQSPGGYLRGQHTVGQSRLEFEFAQLLIVMRKLCE